MGTAKNWGGDTSRSAEGDGHAESSGNFDDGAKLEKQKSRPRYTMLPRGILLLGVFKFLAAGTLGLGHDDSCTSWTNTDYLVWWNGGELACCLV